MRILMWLSVGFFCACAMYAYLVPTFCWALLAIPAVFVAVLLFLLRKRPCAAAALVLLGFAAGSLYTWIYDGAVLCRARELDGQTRIIELEVSDYSFDTGYGTAVDGVFSWKNTDLTVRLYLSDGETFAPGDRVTTRARLRYTPSGGAEKTTYHKGDGIYLLAYGQELLQHEQAQQIPKRYLAVQWRRAISQCIERIFPADSVGFAKGLLLGDDSDLTFTQSNDFSRSGIRHVIAVSGLHVSILFSVVYVLTAKRGKLTFFVGAPVLFLFAAIAGFTPSVVRACIMQGLMIFSIAIRREYDSASALGTAVIVLLLINPLAAASVSFQLSVASTAGIYAFSGKLRDHWLGKLKKPNRLLSGLITGVSTSLGAMSMTLPLCAIHFGTVGVIAVVTNLLTLWCVNVIFYAVMAAVLLGFVWTPLGQIVGFLAAWPIRYVLTVAHTMALIPFGTLYTGSVYTVLWLVATYGLLLVFFRYKRKKPLLFACTIALLYGLTVLATCAEPCLDSYRLTVLDVGQGQCILLQSRREAYLIDCGGSREDYAAEQAIAAMGAQGLTRLDGVILTHYDSDHAGDVCTLLSCVGVDRLYLPDTDETAPIRQQLQSQEVPITWIGEIATFSCGDGQVTLLPTDPSASGNESSMCILFQTENCDILITGDRDQDGERLLLEQATIPDIEVLAVGHHGAATSTAIDFLEAIRPEIAVISVGESNTHGHPDSGTLNRLKRAGCTVYRTDLDGTVIIRG